MKQYAKPFKCIACMKYSRVLFSVFLCVFLLGCAEREKYTVIHEMKPHFSHFEKEYEEVLPFHVKDIEEAKNASDIFISVRKPPREFLGIDSFDLNNDGVKEIFVWVETPILCGPNICPQTIYQRDDKDILHPIDDASIHGGPSILASQSHGYHDLAYYWWGEGKEFYVIYRWNGKKYELSERVSVDQIKIH